MSLAPITPLKTPYLSFFEVSNFLAFDIVRYFIFMMLSSRGLKLGNSSKARTLLTSVRNVPSETFDLALYTKLYDSFMTFVMSQNCRVIKLISKV